MVVEKGIIFLVKEIKSFFPIFDTKFPQKSLFISS